MKKTILITGGTGYIGSHAVVAFEQAGYKTVIVDNLSNSSIESLDNIEKIIGNKPDFFEIDLKDLNQLKEVFKKYNFFSVIHFAGLKSVGESTQSPFLYYENNILGSLNLFNLMDEYNCRNIIFSSSATVYNGEKNKMPFTEESILGTSNPYGTTKLVLEQILKDLSITRGFSVIALRYFNPIGAHESGLIGEKPNGIPDNLLPYIMDVAISKREKVLVYGDDYDTRDGTGIRDYIHVEDLAGAHLKALEKIESEDNIGFKAINLGTGKGTSVLEMIDMVSLVTKKEIPIEIISRRIGDLAEVYSDSSFAGEYLGWKVQKSIEDAIKDSWNFNLKMNAKN